MTAAPVLNDARSSTRGPGVLRTLLRNPLADASLVVLVALCAVSALSPVLQPFPPRHVELGLTNAAPFQTHYFLGGDQYGRDILSRLIAAAPSALESAAIMVVVAVAVGVTAGLVAGYFGSVVDSIGSWVFSVVMAAPAVMILIALYSLVGASLPVAMLVFGILVSPTLFWLVRQLTRSVRGEPYVDAARVSGLSTTRIVGRHILLAIRGPIVITASFLAGAAVAVQAGLEFLGLGDPNSPSWGGMLTDAFSNIYVASWQLIWPGLALGLVVAAFVLLGNALRDAFEGTYVKQSGRARRREIERLLGDQAASKTLGLDARSMEPADEGAGDGDPLLVIEGLHIAYSSRGRLDTVVEGVSLHVADGEVVGLVGESGSGKTQTVFAALGLLPDEAIVTRGSIRLQGSELLGKPERQLSRFRGRVMGYVAQEPMSNLDPSFTIGSQLIYGIRAQSGVSRQEAWKVALAMLDRVGIRDPKRTFASYPHQISGGMAQRVLIAGAVACGPKLLIADEPTTALDVTVQAEVLDLLRDLQKERGMGVLIVTHNFGVVADLCDRVAVMRTGQIVEEGPVDRVFREPRHEYTKMLLDSILDEASTRAESSGRAHV